MPHLILEYSDNAIADDGVADLLQRLHASLAGAGVDEARIKARAIALRHYIAGRADEGASMMHLTLLLLEGRDDGTKRAYAEPLRALMVGAALADCKVTIEVRDMRWDTYLM